MLLPSVPPERVRQLTGRFADARVLVIGDAMLDTFVVGRVTRISPEAPVPVVSFDHELHRMGGSANVANNIAALGGSATLVAVTGTDQGAATLVRACREAGIVPALVGDPARPTTTKVRIVTERHQQVARVDYEVDADIKDEIEHRLIAEINTHAPQASAIVISDYLKGCITRAVVKAVVAAAGERGVPVLVDPKIPHVDYYAGTTVVTPNHHEAEIAANMRVRNEDEARGAARLFRDRAGCRSVLMTRGDQGMWLLAGDAEGHLPAVAREVADVTGAGDTVIATLALALAVGATMVEAARLANEAAGLVVARFGPATVRVSELVSAFERA
jgi:D-beta-D-heptose 7-phosphate kinase/D-beta-D-heptose 1-phosphate adenosyltransferase